MKKFYTLLLIALGSLSTQSLLAQGEFITVWKVSAGEITIPINSDVNGFFNYDIAWTKKDGTPISNASSIGATDYTINGLTDGDTIIVKISGNFPAIAIGWGSSQNQLRLIDIQQWGNIQWETFSSAFQGCANLTNISATDAPDLTNVYDLSYMFAGANNLASIAPIEDEVHTKANDLGNWDVGQITNMEGMFQNASQFNGDLGNWDVGQVTNMAHMFSGATHYNGDLGNWDVGQVTNMSYMFSGATQYNGDLGNWDVGQVTNMSYMFSGATQYNGDLGNWDVGQVTNMANMFSGATQFNGDLGNWDVGQLGNGITGEPNYISFANSGMDCSNYSLTLQGWANQIGTAQDVIMDATGISYSPDVVNERTALINNRNWTINGDVEDPNCFLSLDKQVAPSFTIYPNPTQNQFTITGLKGYETIQLMDMTGRILQTVKNHNQNAQSVEVNSLANGVYNLVISNENGQRVTQKLIKQ